MECGNFSTTQKNCVCIRRHGDDRSVVAVFCTSQHPIAPDAPAFPLVCARAPPPTPPLSRSGERGERTDGGRGERDTHTGRTPLHARLSCLLPGRSSRGAVVVLWTNHVLTRWTRTGGTRTPSRRRDGGGRRRRRRERSVHRARGASEARIDASDVVARVQRTPSESRSSPVSVRPIHATTAWSPATARAPRPAPG